MAVTLRWLMVLVALTGPMPPRKKEVEHASVDSRALSKLIKAPTTEPERMVALLIHVINISAFLKSGQGLEKQEGCISPSPPLRAERSMTFMAIEVAREVLAGVKHHDLDSSVIVR